MIGNANLITKVYFPRIILPVTPALVGLVDFAIGFLLFIGLMVYYQLALSWKLLLWPVLMIPLMLFTSGLGTLLSAMNVKYRDIKYAVPFIIQLLLFATPVIYPASAVPERFRWLISLNPLTGLIEAFRAVCLPERPLDWSALGISLGVTLCLAVISVIYFNKAEGYFSDIV
ncbi:MAG: hypothetical protein EPO39_10140 [Candidatus Manganitrophaceae bacterium]|nr:MAG: hypothetical protein EPO39_10140 [Candidatus Manganitrophaceae bacterium]